MGGSPLILFSALALLMLYMGFIFGILTLILTLVGRPKFLIPPSQREETD